MSEVRCAYAGCQLPRPVGQYLCAYHSHRPKTLKESIAVGPKFTTGDDSHCATCGSLGYHDTRTGLCLACWRAWRFSMDRKS